MTSYPKEALRLFREAMRTGKAGRPRLLVLPEGVMVARVIKRYAKRRVKEVVRRVVRGTRQAVRARAAQTQRCAQAIINTAYIVKGSTCERLNAAFRARLAPLARRTRAGVHRRATLEAGMWLVGCCYNFCRTHRSLLVVDEAGRKREERTPAQAAGLGDRCWSLGELLSFSVPPAETPKWRGRRPSWLVEADVRPNHGSMWRYLIYRTSGFRSFSFSASAFTPYVSSPPSP